MKKTFLMAAVGLAMSLSAHAVRAVHQLFPQPQSDGTTVMLYTNGDGRLAFYTTADDQVVVRDSKGTLCYAAYENGKLVPTSIVVHNVGERTAEEKAFVSSNTLKPTDQPLLEMLAPQPFFTENTNRLQKSIIASTSDGLGKYGTRSMGPIPSIGKITLPVIMVEFSDRKFQDYMTTDKFSRFMNAEGYHEDDDSQKGSVRDYFISQSRGMFEPTFDVVAKITLDKSYAYYGANKNGSKDVNVRTMLSEAITKATAEGVDFSKYNVDGKIPNVIILYAGYGEATGGDENTIWPHASEYVGGKIGNNEFASYFVGNELYGASGNRIMGMGVMVHELGHVLGLPDFYETQYTYQDEDNPMGFWSVMDCGEYYPGSTAYAPVGYNAYERSYMGWLDIRELNNEEAVKLSTVKDTDGEYAVLLRNPLDTKEYFILENRSDDTWFPSSLGTGLLVTRIAYNETAWLRNRVNQNQKYKRAMVVTASGRKMTDLGQAGDLFGNGKNNIDEFTLYNSQAMATPVYRILKNPDGVLTFSFKDKAKTVDYAISDDTKYERVTDASTLAAGDEIVVACGNQKLAMTSTLGNGTLQSVSVNQTDGNLYGNDLVLPLTLKKSGPNWLLQYGKRYLTATNSGLKFNTSMSASSFVSIAFDSDNATIKFGGSVKNNILGFDEDAYQFITSADSKNNIQIYRKSSATGISAVNTDNTVNSDYRMFNLSGQQVGEGYKGIVIVNGKKVLRK